MSLVLPPQPRAAAEALLCRLATPRREVAAAATAMVRLAKGLLISIAVEEGMALLAMLAMVLMVPVRTSLRAVQAGAAKDGDVRVRGGVCYLLS